MNLRKFKHDRADLLRQGEEIAAARNIDPRYKSRVVAVSMVLSGRCTVAQAAELAGAIPRQKARTRYTGQRAVSQEGNEGDWERGRMRRHSRERDLPVPSAVLPRPEPR